MKQNEKTLKLTIELVPQTSWYDNLRKYITQTTWDTLRKQVYADYGYRCGICGAAGRLNCHEIWEYDDKQHIQKLAGFVALCNMCHHVKHIGLAGIIASEGKLDYEHIVEHFCLVNNCDKDTFEKHRKAAFDQWWERSQYEWRVDLGEYESIVRKKDGANK